MSMKHILIAGGVLFSLFASAAVPLVKDGKAVSEIVLAEGTSLAAKWAAADFQDHVKKMTGATLPVVKTPTAGVRHVFMGESAFTKAAGVSADGLTGSAYRIVTGRDFVALLGHDIHRKGFPYRWNETKKWQDACGEYYQVPDISSTFDRYQHDLGMFANDATPTWYAASALLEQFGVRWYMQGEDGTVIPNAADLVVADQNVTRAPHFAIRHYYINPTADMLRHFKRLGYGNDALYCGGHGIYDVISDPNQQKAHPEYLAKRDGKIDPGFPAGRGRPKLTNPGLRASSAKYFDEVVKAYPDVEGLNLAMPDGFDEIDEDDAKLFPRGSRYTNRFNAYVWDYWLDMAKRIGKQNPDKYLIVMPYGPCEEAPESLGPLPKNVAVNLVTGSFAYSMTQPSRKKAVQDLYEKWIGLATSKKIYLWEHFLFYGGIRNCPSFFTKGLQEQMRYLDGKVMGKFIECMVRQGWTDLPAITHWFYYLQGKLFWNPDLDLQALMDEYYARFFGPAAAEMKAFYETAEAVYMRPETRAVTAYAGFLKEKDIENYFRLLAAARGKVEKGSVYDRRIALFEKEMEPLKVLFRDLERSGPSIRMVSTSEERLVPDCNFEDPFWKGAVALWMKDCRTGKELAKNKTLVRMKMSKDGRRLHFGVTCYEEAMAKVSARTTGRDDQSIFTDEDVEIYVETPTRSYFKIAFNANGAIYDESRDSTIVARDTLPILWDSGAKVCAKKGSDRWELELVLPTTDFGENGPTLQQPWGINVGRARHIDGLNAEWQAISPTGSGFAVLNKLANILPPPIRR